MYTWREKTYYFGQNIFARITHNADNYTKISIHLPLSFRIVRAYAQL